MHSLGFDQRHRYQGDHGIGVPVLLRHGDHAVEFSAKVDTGAEFCIFQGAYGEQLGLDVEAGEPKSIGTAIGQGFLTFGHIVTVEVLSYTFESTIYFAQDKEFRRNVLGRNGWLNKCRIAIVDHDELLYLSEYNQ